MASVVLIILYGTEVHPNVILPERTLAVTKMINLVETLKITVYVRSALITGHRCKKRGAR